MFILLGFPLPLQALVIRNGKVKSHRLIASRRCRQVSLTRTLTQVFVKDQVLYLSLPNSISLSLTLSLSPKCQGHFFIFCFLVSERRACYERKSDPKPGCCVRTLPELCRKRNLTKRNLIFVHFPNRILLSI